MRFLRADCKTQKHLFGIKTDAVRPRQWQWLSSAQARTQSLRLNSAAKIDFINLSRFHFILFHFV